MKTTRRQMMALTASALWASPPSDQAPDWVAAIVKQTDEGVDRNLAHQVTDPASPYLGGMPDATGLHHPGTASGLINGYCAVFHHPLSRFHKSPLMLERLRLAAQFITRSQSPDGNIDLLVTNYNSPPDTAFSVRNIAQAALIARRAGTREMEAAVEPFLHKAAGALIKGGVHTPNHRWVVCAALAQINELYPDPALVRRAGQWLAEGIDIDADGQYDERSTLVYNVITDSALITVADKLKRPELLEPVRKNLDSAFYLMHPGGEMVTEISHRQDRDTRGDIGVYQFPMHFMAVRDRNPLYTWAAQKYASERAGLANLLEYPELTKPWGKIQEPDTDYEKVMRDLEVVRIRRGEKSATILLNGDSRFLHLRSGDAVIQAVRFASAFFGKAQFIPQSWMKQGDSYVLKQSLSAPYWQPLDPPRRIHALEWNDSRAGRKQTEVNFLEQSAALTETPKGFRVRAQAHGTKGVPVAVEVSVRGQEGLKLDGLLRAPGVTDGFLLAAGYAVVRVGDRQIRFGPGKQEHQYTQVRGAEPKLPGGSVYLTGYTPFDHTIEFECT